MLEAARLACLILWFVPAVMLPGSVWRSLVGKPQDHDHFKAAFFFMALLIIGFVGRWYIAPADEEIWTALYVLSATLAGYVILLVRPRGPAR
jgi:hypothetical protein